MRSTPLTPELRAHVAAQFWAWLLSESPADAGKKETAADQAAVSQQEVRRDGDAPNT